MSDTPKNKRPRSQATTSAPRDSYVVPIKSGWAVRSSGARRASGVYPTQGEAVEAAKRIVRDSGGMLRVQGRDGRFRESFTIGRDPFAKISAVEGVRLSADMKQAFREFDRDRLSEEDRRREIVKR
jgi:Uncharacterized protein conserved in bacteria (DUF2188)